MRKSGQKHGHHWLVNLRSQLSVWTLTGSGGEYLCTVVKETVSGFHTGWTGSVAPYVMGISFLLGDEILFLVVCRLPQEVSLF